MGKSSVPVPRVLQGRDSQAFLCLEDEYQIELLWRAPVASELHRVRRGTLELAFQRDTASVAFLYRLRSTDSWSSLDLRHLPTLTRHNRVEVLLRNGVNGKLEVRRAFAIEDRFLDAWLEAYTMARRLQGASAGDARADVRVMTGPRLLSTSCVPYQAPVQRPTVVVNPGHDDTHSMPPLVPERSEHRAPLQATHSHPTGSPASLRLVRQSTATPAAEPTGPIADTNITDAAKEAAAEGFITLAEAAQRCGLSPATLRSQATRRGRKLQVERIGKRLLVTTPGWLEAYLDGRDPRGGRRARRTRASTV